MKKHKKGNTTNAYIISVKYRIFWTIIRRTQHTLHFSKIESALVLLSHLEPIMW